MSQYRIFSKPRQNLKLPGRFRWLGIGSLWLYRVLTWAVLAIGLAFAGTVLALRYWVFPNIDSYREDLARIVSERAGQKVTIGSIYAQWEGLRPQLVLERVTVHDATGRPALELLRVDQTLSWLSVPTLQLRTYSLDIYRPRLSIRRDARDVVTIAGFEVTGGGGSNAFVDSLLRQREIEVHDATIVWNDELRKAPELELTNVQLHLVNSGGRHRFGLRATPPKELSAPLDIRGDLGAAVAALADWDGMLFLELEYADIAAWRTWVPFPIEFPRGAGALRAWFTFSRDRLVEAVADVQLANVLTRVGGDLPQLDLSQLSGRLGWKQSDKGFEISTSKLGLTTTGGLKLPPVDFLLRVNTTGAGKPSGGELQASAIELAPLVALAEHLPFGQATRRQLAEYSPRGRLSDMVMRWSGEWSEPREYSARVRFQRLSLNPVGRIPGFAGASGTVEATERGGTLLLNSQKATLEMPLVFRGAHELDALSAQISWEKSGGETELRINNVAFSNAHLAGTVFGVYRTAGTTSGSIDLTGRLTRADARFVSRYIPLAVGKKARDWLDSAFIAGRSNNVTLRMKGKLADYPFPDGRDGVFQITARVADGTLHYADGWPDITHIAGDVVFRGSRMEVHAWEGAISGVRLAKVRADIPDLKAKVEILNLSGEAEGPTGEFLAFIEKSQVSGMIDDFTRGWQAQGAGRLTLKFSLPLSGPAKPTIAGAYQFTNNTVKARNFPDVEQASGRIEFSEAAVRGKKKGVVLGGPATVSATTTSDGVVTIGVQGRINADVARRAGGPQWLRHLRGSTDWRATITARRGGGEMVIESNLQGLAVNLPAPFVKTAAEVWPTRLERRTLPAGRQDELLSLAVGDILSMNLLMRDDGKEQTIARGSVRFGAAAGEPDRNGVWVSGAVKALDLDRWLDFIGPGPGGLRIEWGGADVSVGTLDALGWRFSGLAVKASVEDGQWRTALTGKELEGEATWHPQDRGRLVARMKTLAIPAASPGAAPAAGSGPQSRVEPQDLPALDVVAEQFLIKDVHYGRLELSAVPEGRDWRLERLSIANPDGNLALDGVWKAAQPRPLTQANLRLEASDIGKLLQRLRYPEGVRGGTARLEGSLSWSGVLYELDYPTMSGNLKLDAAKGQFTKLDPGIGKLLGVLNLQSLPRRATLDFSDVFSEGFAFDDVSGAARIERGTATTENFRIRGPSANVVMKGTVDLAGETQNLRVRITPQISGSVAVGTGALVGGPVGVAAGVAAYLAQKVLKDPFGQLASFEYDVAGTWSEPTVKRVRLPPPVPVTGTE